MSKRFLRTSTTIIVLAIAFSSFTLWLVESWIKYPLFVYEVFTIVFIYLVIEHDDFGSKLVRLDTRRLRISLMVDVLMIASACTLLIMSLSGTQGGLVQLFLGLLCTSFLSGFCLMSVFNLTAYFSRLETMILSFVLSYTFTGLVTLASLTVNEDLRIGIILSSFVILGFVAAIRSKGHQTIAGLRSLSRNTDLLSLLLVASFYVISFCLMYPGFALLPGTDASQHYAQSVVLWRTPDLYISFNYILANLHEAALIFVSHSSEVLLQGALISLNLLLPLAFYAMVKPYLGRIDARLPSLATLFWVLFTNGLGGFSWLIFAWLNLTAPSLTEFQRLDSTAYVSQYGTMYGILGLWYVPVVVSFIIMMTTIFLMSKKEIPASKYVAIFTTMMVASYLTHVIEAAFFALFLAVYGMVSKNRNIRIDGSIASSLLSFAVVSALYIVFPLFSVRSGIGLSQVIVLIGTSSALLFSLAFRRVIRPRLCSVSLSSARFIGKNSIGQTLGRMLAFVVFLFYVVALFVWLSLMETPIASQANTIGSVPWFMYPLVIGINAFLGLLGLLYIAEAENRKKAYVFFVGFLVFAFVFARIVSIINFGYFQTGYSERRFIWFLKIPLALLAPIAVIHAAGKIRSTFNKTSVKTAAAVSLVGMVVLLGFSTNVTNLAYWNYMTSSPANLPSNAELEAINSLAAMIDGDPRSWLATVTGTSAALGVFARPPDQLVLRQLLSTAKSPEMLFMQLYRHPGYSHPYIYVADRDAEALGDYADSALGSYLNIVPVCFENSEVRIYNSSKPSFPQDRSDSTLVLPFDNFLSSWQLLAGYCMLSSGYKNYTVGYDLEDWIFLSKTLILSYDPPSQNVSRIEYDSTFDQGMGQWQTISGLWRTENGSLVAGDGTWATEGIALSPVIAEDFNSSFTVRLDASNPIAPTCVSLVYSLNDEQHFRMATLVFNSDGFVYALTSSIEGTDWSSRKEVPSWPGKNTSVEWRPGHSYEIGLSVESNFTQVLVDRQEVLKLRSVNPAGRVGFAYNGSGLVSFDDFSVSGSVTVELRPVTDYLQFAASGGTIVVLNTNGYEEFAKRMLAVQNGSIMADLIEGATARVALPMQIPTEISFPLNASLSAIANYTSSSGQSSSCIVRQQVGNGSVFYINIYPILRATIDVSTPIFSALGELLDFVNLSNMASQVIQVDGYFKVAILDSVTGTADTLLFPLWIEIKSMDLRTGGGTQHLENVTAVYLSSTTLSFACDEMRMLAGRGLYSVFRIDSAFNVTSDTLGFSMKVVTTEGELSFQSVTDIRIAQQEGGIIVLARTPRVQAERAILGELFSFGDLSSRTGAYGQDLEVSGRISFHVRISDRYSVLQGVDMTGSWKLTPQLVIYDELATLPLAAFWTLILLPYMIILVVSTGNRKKGSHQPGIVLR